MIKAYSSERHEAARFAAQSHLLVRDSVAVLKSISLLSSGSAAAAGYVAVILLVIGGRSVAAGDMSLGSLVMYLWLSGFLLAPALHITGSIGEVGKALAAAGRIADSEGSQPRPRRISDTQPPLYTRGRSPWSV